MYWGYTLSRQVHSFNHFIPCLLFGAIFINKVLDKAGLLFTSSLLLICSPFGGLAFTLYHGLRTSSLFSELKTPRALLLLAAAVILALLTPVPDRNRRQRNRCRKYRIVIHQKTGSFISALSLIHGRLPGHQSWNSSIITISGLSQIPHILDYSLRIACLFTHLHGR